MQYLQISRTDFNALFSVDADFLRTELVEGVKTTYYQTWGAEGKEVINFNDGTISYYRTLSV